MPFRGGIVSVLALCLGAAPLAFAQDAANELHFEFSPERKESYTLPDNVVQCLAEFKDAQCTGLSFKYFLNTKTKQLYAEQDISTAVTAFTHTHMAFPECTYEGPSYSDYQKMEMLEKMGSKIMLFIAAQKNIFILPSAGQSFIAPFENELPKKEDWQPLHKSTNVFHFFELNEKTVLKDGELAFYLGVQATALLAKMNMPPAHSMAFFGHPQFYIGHVLAQAGGFYQVETRKKQWQEFYMEFPTEFYIFFDKETLRITDLRIAHCK
jgi:hypothetical protein